MTDSERIAELELIVAELQAVIGDYHNRADMSKRPTELPSGEYPILFRQRQLGLGVDELAARVEALESRPAQAPSNPFPAGTQVIDGDVVFTGRVGLGGLKPDARARLHIMDNRSASILFVTNMDKAQYQEGAEHISELCASDDSGIRIFQNMMTTISTRPEYDPDTGVTYQSMMKYFLNPGKPQFMMGPDSKGRLSISREEPGRVYDRTQLAVLMDYPDQKMLVWELWQRGWNWKFGINGKYGPGAWTAPLV